MNVSEVIERLAPFRGLKPQCRRVLAEGAGLRRFAAGELLWAAGTEPRGLFVVVAGRVRVVRAPQGRQYAVHSEGPGGTLGEVPLFSGGRYPATAIAAEPTVCLALGREVLARAIAADPALAFALLQRLAERVRLLVARLDRGTNQPVTARLAAYLLERHRSAAGGFLLGGTQAEVAEELGTVREVLVRALRDLRERGVVEAVARGRYRVLDAQALARLAAAGRRAAPR